MTEFEKRLHDMFGHIWECEIDHPIFQDTVGELMRAVIQCYNNLSSAQPEQRWIPVSEGLPKEYGEYICTMKNGQVQECGFVPENQRGLVDGWSTCEADGHKFLGYADVLAWMPLPEPYREEGADE